MGRSYYNPDFGFFQTSLGLHPNCFLGFGRLSFYYRLPMFLGHIVGMYPFLYPGHCTIHKKGNIRQEGRPNLHWLL